MSVMNYVYKQEYSKLKVLFLFRCLSRIDAIQSPLFLYLKETMKRYCDLSYYGVGETPIFEKDAEKICQMMYGKNKYPDVIFMILTTNGFFYENIDKIPCVKFFYKIDPHYDKRVDVYCENNCDVVLSTIDRKYLVNKENISRVEHDYFFPSANTYIYKDYNLRKQCDILLSGTFGETYDLRNEILLGLTDPDEKDSELKKYKTIILPGRSQYNKFREVNQSRIAKRNKLSGVEFALPYTSFTGKEYAKWLNRGKIAITCSSIYKYPIIKMFEIMACPTALMCDEPLHADEIGMVDGENYIKVDRFDYKDKIKFYLKNESLMNKIIENGNKLILNNHTTDIRCKQLVAMMYCKRFGVKPMLIDKPVSSKSKPPSYINKVCLFSDCMDWANVGYEFSLCLRSVGVEAQMFAKESHVFNYAHEGIIYKTYDEVKEWARDCQAFIYMHSIYKDLGLDFSNKVVGVFHGGNCYRRYIENKNKQFNAIADISYIQTPDLLDKGAKNQFWLLPPIDLDAISPRYSDFNNRRKIKIAHHPRMPKDKGTENNILPVMRKLQEDPKINYKFDFIYDATQVSWPDSIKRMGDCDIYIESLVTDYYGVQLLFWGVTGLEVSALGKVVVTAMQRKDEYERLYGPCPIIATNTPEELEIELRKLINLSYESITTIQHNTRKWVETYHSYEYIGHKIKESLENIYVNKVLKKRTNVNMTKDGGNIVIPVEQNDIVHKDNEIEEKIKNIDSKLKNMEVMMNKLIEYINTVK